MLFHSLPVDRASCCSLAIEAIPANPRAVAPLLPVRLARAVLAIADLAGIGALSWVFVRSVVPASGWLAAAPWGMAAALGVLLVASRVLGGRGPFAGAALPCTVAAGMVLFAKMDAQITPIFFAACAVLWMTMLRLSWHAGVAALLRRGWCLERVLVIGPSIADARRIGAVLIHRAGKSLHVTTRAAVRDNNGTASLGATLDLLRHEAFDHVIVLDPCAVPGRLQEAVAKLLKAGARVTLAPCYDNTARHAGEAFSLATLAMPAPPLTEDQAKSKRALDVGLGLAASVLAMPLLLAIAAAIKLDSAGPVLFCQARVGLNGAVFRLWKFRTMHEHAADAPATLQTSRNDGRVTRLGRFLRRTSLDELPQLYNVVRGDMSIVGPRPHAVGMTVAGRSLNELLPSYDQRHRVRPGITGWAQVNGCRGELVSEKALRRRLALDCHYIEGWSLRLDTAIVTRTASLLFQDRHAF